ncbi:hypothetical protein MRX96_054811 [Rhipicephalus microplus]
MEALRRRCVSWAGVREGSSRRDKACASVGGGVFVSYAKAVARERRGDIALSEEAGRFVCGDTRTAAVVEHGIAILERKAGFTAFRQLRRQTAHKLIVYFCLTGKLDNV